MGLFLLFIWPRTGSKSTETNGTSLVQMWWETDVDQASSAVITGRASYSFSGFKEAEMAFSARLLVKKPFCQT